MKVLEIDFNYCYYPKGISCIEDFIAYANGNYNSFIELTCFDTNNCAPPYFIDGETKTVYINVARINEIRETDVTVLSKLDYDIRLEQVVKAKCVDCEYYEEHSEEDNLKGHREKISLDGECPWYSKRNSET